MGELEEKETPENNQTTENQSIEPKETDKMLQPQDNDNNEDNNSNKPPSNGEEIINIPEPAEKGGENEKKDENDGSDDKKDNKSDSKKLLAKEDREVKPKKIPIGGMKLPGFFTKAKPKAEGDGADGELLEKDTKEEDNKEKKVEGEKPPCLGDRIRNFFAKKKKPVAATEETKNG